MHVGIGVFGKQLAMSLETVVDLYLDLGQGPGSVPAVALFDGHIVVGELADLAFVLLAGRVRYRNGGRLVGRVEEAGRKSTGDTFARFPPSPRWASGKPRIRQLHLKTLCRQQHSQPKPWPQKSLRFAAFFHAQPLGKPEVGKCGDIQNLVSGKLEGEHLLIRTPLAITGPMRFPFSSCRTTALRRRFGPLELPLAAGP